MVVQTAMEWSEKIQTLMQSNIAPPVKPKTK